MAPTLVLCSPARRTADTLAAFTAALGAAVAVRIEPSLYGATAGDVLDLVRSVPEDVASLMVVGHNPCSQDLVLALAGSGRPDLVERVERKFPTGAIATLAVARPWSELAGGSAELTGLVVPRELP